MARALAIAGATFAAALAILPAPRGARAEGLFALVQRFAPYARGQIPLRICLAQQARSVRISCDAPLALTVSEPARASITETDLKEVVFTAQRAARPAYLVQIRGFAEAGEARKLAQELCARGFVAQAAELSNGAPVVLVEGDGEARDAPAMLQRVCQAAPLPAGTVAVVVPGDRVPAPVRVALAGAGADGVARALVSPAAGHALALRWYCPGARQPVVERRVRGTVELRAGREGIIVINIVGLEEYLAGVVGSEMPSDAPPAALRAQAIVARTYALANLGRFAGEGYDLTADVRCQVYRGVAAESAAVCRAVRETRGKVLAAGGKLAPCPYFACCGGCTEAAREVWPVALAGCLARLDEPGGAPPQLGEEQALRRFLLAPRRAFCSWHPCFRWRRRFSASELEQKLQRSLPVLLGTQEVALGRLLDIKIARRTASGRVAALAFVGSQNSYTVERSAIRWAFGTGTIDSQGLYSTLFAIDKERGQDGVPVAYELFGGGWGHGVGLCQAGALGMAREGYSEEQILAHYYPQSSLVNLLESQVARAG